MTKTELAEKILSGKELIFERQDVFIGKGPWPGSLAGCALGMAYCAAVGNVQKAYNRYQSSGTCWQKFFANKLNFPIGEVVKINNLHQGGVSAIEIAERLKKAA